MANNDREQVPRVSIGRVKKLTSQKSGRDWFVGNMGMDKKLLILPVTRKSDDGQWEVVDGQFEVFLQQKTPQEIEETRAYFDSRRNGGGNGGEQRSSSSSSSSSSSNGSQQQRRDEPKKDYSRDPNDEIPF